MLPNFWNSEHFSHDVPNLLENCTHECFSCTQPFRNKTEFKGMQMTQGTIYLRFSHKFTQSPISCNEIHRRGEHCVQNTVIEKEGFPHLPADSSVLHTVQRHSSDEGKRIQRSNLKMTAELFLQRNEIQQIHSGRCTSLTKL